MFVLFVFELDYECKLIKTREMCSRIDMQTHVERLGLGFVSAYRGPAMSTDFGADRSICLPFRARTNRQTRLHERPTPHRRSPIQPARVTKHKLLKRYALG